MSKLETLLEDGLRSELMLQQQLRSLSEALKQQLQETERRLREELERRIHHNALLSKDVSSDKNELTHQTRPVGLRRSTSTPALPSDKVSNHPRQSERPNSSSPVWISSSTWKHCSDRTSRPTRAQQCERAALFKTTQMKKEEEAEAECQKKFCALPVPNHVSLPLYQEMIELREKERRQGLEQRKHFLLSVQKPFSFQEREKEKREKLIAMLNQVSQDQKNKTASVGKSLHKGVKDTDTLPTYITDAARKRCMAIRKSMEMRDSKNQESADWLKKYQLRSQAMKRTVALHAKLLDPHNSLKEVYNEKLQHHREADQQRMRDYMRELRDMKARVSERPYLFEQVKQRNAKAHAEQTYRNKLRKAGLKEQFVEENGEAAAGGSTSSVSEDDVNDCSRENDIHSSDAEEENVDDGEKIEDVEEKSVKSKGDEMP
eukprot:superscaffoldBa00001335_g10109